MRLGRRARHHPSSPCDKVKPPTAEHSRDRVLTDDELRRLWTATDAIGWPFRDLVRLLMLTGQRRDEIGRMRWSELDLDAALWTIPKERAKNGQAHLVPLSAPAVAILRACRRCEGGKGASTTSSPSTGKTPVSGFSNAKERLDKLMGDGTPHGCSTTSAGPPPPAWRGRARCRTSSRRC